MSLATKLGWILLSGGLLANISGECVSSYYNNKKNNADSVFKNVPLQTNSEGIALCEAIENSERYNSRKDYAQNMVTGSYLLALGGFFALARSRIRVHARIE